MSKNKHNHTQKGGAAVPPPFNAEKAAKQTVPPPFQEGDESTVPATSGEGMKLSSTEAPKANKQKQKAATGVKLTTEPPKKKVKTWVWIVGIFLVLGVIGQFTQDDKNRPKSTNQNKDVKSQVEQTVKAKSSNQASAEDGESSAALASKEDGANTAAKASAAEPVREPYEGDILDLPRPDALVNDFACVFPDSVVKAMDYELKAFSGATSNQIVVVTVTDLYGENPNIYAAKLGDKWGVGQKKEDNGLIILIKPKTDKSKGEVAIAPGRGLEGALPDAFCNRIIQDEMIPELKKGNDYVAATRAALDVIMPVCRGEYNYESYEKAKDEEDEVLGWIGWTCLLLIWGPILFLIIDGVFLKDHFSKKWGLNSGSGSGTWSSSSSSSSYSSSSSSSSWSSSSSSSSSWGGFGGGSFSGGGASGSW